MPLSQSDRKRLLLSRSAAFDKGELPLSQAELNRLFEALANCAQEDLIPGSRLHFQSVTLRKHADGLIEVCLKNKNMRRAYEILHRQ